MCASRCFLSGRPSLFGQRDCLFRKGSTGGGCARLFSAAPGSLRKRRNLAATGELFTRAAAPLQERIKKTDCSGSARPLAASSARHYLGGFGAAFRTGPEGRGFAKPAGRDRSRRRSPPAPCLADAHRRRQSRFAAVLLARRPLFAFSERKFHDVRLLRPPRPPSRDRSAALCVDRAANRGRIDHTEDDRIGELRLVFRSRGQWIDSHEQVL